LKSLKNVHYHQEVVEIVAAEIAAVDTKVEHAAVKAEAVADHHVLAAEIAEAEAVAEIATVLAAADHNLQLNVNLITILDQ
jgi:hypothetical protein